MLRASAKHLHCRFSSDPCNTPMRQVLPLPQVAREGNEAQLTGLSHMSVSL